MPRLLPLVALGLAVALLASPASTEVTLRVSLQLPLKSHLGQTLVLFKDELERKGQGDIKVEI